jgi:hypothetical protein
LGRCRAELFNRSDWTDRPYGAVWTHGTGRRGGGNRLNRSDRTDRTEWPYGTDRGHGRFGL